MGTVTHATVSTRLIGKERRLTVGKREENLLAKIAQFLNKDVEEVKEIKAVYTEEEAILEAQSVSNYFHWRKRLQKGPKETDEQFARRQKMWQYKDCKECDGRFAYSYHYDGVKFCSLDCLKSNLAKMGITYHPNRPPEQRWGFTRPGIVPSSALAAIESALEFSASDSDALAG
jgi:hypothetical protein